MMIPFLSFFFACFSVQAEPFKNFELKNELRFFSQKVQDGFVLPTPLNDKQDLLISVQVDEALSAPSLRKVFTTEYIFANLKATIELYHFNQNNEKYFSQQIFLYKEKHLIAKCTSYFPETQGFLVPGVCSGVTAEMLWGLSIFRK